MITVKGQRYSERWDTATILDEQEEMRRDPVDNRYEQILFRRPGFRPETRRSEISSAIAYRNLIEKLTSRHRERKMRALPGTDDK